MGWHKKKHRQDPFPAPPPFPRIVAPFPFPPKPKPFQSKVADLSPIHFRKLSATDGTNRGSKYWWKPRFGGLIQRAKSCQPWKTTNHEPTKPTKVARCPTRRRRTRRLFESVVTRRKTFQPFKRLKRNERNWLGHRCQRIQRCYSDLSFNSGPFKPKRHPPKKTVVFEITPLFLGWNNPSYPPVN